MFKSMTAYGRATTVSSIGRFSVELQSVNRKHLEVTTFLPSELLRFDGDIKKWISEVVTRGLVNVRVHVAFEESCAINVTANVPLAEKVVAAWKHLGNQLSLKFDDQTIIKFLSSVDDILLFEPNASEEEKYREILHDAIKKALRSLIEMKEAEGKTLHHDISSRFEILKHQIDEINLKAPFAVDRYRTKLIERLQEALGDLGEHEDKILREVCIFAEKVDIAEEITRFNSHLGQVKKLISTSSNQGVAKSLEFILQELNREANTIGSKCSDIDVTNHVIRIKQELERIREQIQNIE